MAGEEIIDAEVDGGVCEADDAKCQELSTGFDAVGCFKKKRCDPIKKSIKRILYFGNVCHGIAEWQPFLPTKRNQRLGFFLIWRILVGKKLHHVFFFQGNSIEKIYGEDNEDHEPYDAQDER